MLDPNKYQMIYSEEAIGGRGRFGIKILVQTDLVNSQNGCGELGDDEKDAIRDAAEKIKQSLMAASVAHSPEAQAESRRNREGIVGCFSEPIYVTEIPNEYCNQYCCKHLPWFLVTTQKGVVKIGWRKRVIMIDWSQSDIAASANELFASEDVTKGERYIHAWGYDKAKEYIAKLLA